MYATIEFFDVYINENKLERERYNSIDDERKSILLRIATQSIDNLNFKGEKTDENQINKFPRDKETEIPLDVQKATCEIAFEILNGRDIELERQKVFNSQQGFTKLSKQVSFFHEHILHGIVSFTAWQLLRKYLSPRDQLNFVRVG